MEEKPRLWWIAVICAVFVGSPTSTPPGSLLSLSPRSEILGQAFLIWLVFLSPKSLSELARYLVSEQHSVQQSWMPPAVRQAYPPSWIQWSITVRGWVIIIIPSETETQTSCLMWVCPVIKHDTMKHATWVIYLASALWGNQSPSDGAFLQPQGRMFIFKRRRQVHENVVMLNCFPNLE